MILLRRILASFLILAFLPLFLLVLIVFRVNDTALAADFYIDQLRKAEIFVFLYDELIPAALDELDQDSQDLPINLKVIEDELLSSLREVIPPEWLQEQVEVGISEAVPYAMGDTDSFVIPLLVAERLEKLGEVIKRELGGGDTYDILFDEIIAPVLEEQLQDVGDLPLGVHIAAQDIVAAVQQVMPPQWIQARVEHVVDQLVPYLAGSAEHFAIELPVSDRIEALTPALKDLLFRAGVYDMLSSQEFADDVEERLMDFGELPFGMKLTGDQIVPAVRTVAPPQWLQVQVEHILDEMTLYVTGKQDGFEVVIPLKDRIQAAVPVVKQLLRDAGTYDLMFDQVVSTMVGDNVGPLTELPFGITITADEITPALREVLSPAFVQEQAESMIDGLVPFLTGETAGFRVVVPLADRKEAALGVIERLAEKKLAEVLANLPKCTITQALDLAREGFSGLIPPCIPPGFSLEEIKQELGIVLPGVTTEAIEEQLGIDLTLVTEGVTLKRIEDSFGIDVVGEVGRFIGDALPNEFIYTDVDLRETLGVDDGKTLDDVLDWTRNGFKYTDADLRDDLSGGGSDISKLELLDNALEWGSQGLTYSDADLREDLLGEDGDTTGVETLDKILRWIQEGFTDADLRDLISGEEGGEEGLQQFDDLRRWLGLGRSLWFVLLLVPMGFLAGIGFLGGREWRSRLAWAAVPLGIAAGIAFAGFGPAYLGIAEPFADDQLADVTRDATGVGRVAAEKAVSITKTAMGDFFSGLANTAALLLAISVIGVGVAILWPTLFRRTKEGPPTAEGPEPPGPEPDAPELEDFGQAEPEQETSASEELEPAAPSEEPPSEGEPGQDRPPG